MNKPCKEVKTIIFLHIPKAAGSTLSNIIRRQYKPGEIRDSYPFSLPEKPEGLAALESARWRFDQFAAMPEAQRATTKVFMGHEGFGFHRLFPQPVTYITLLRHPVERIISHYYYVLRSPKNAFHKAVVSGRMSLADYITSGVTPELDNSQTKYLAGLETPYLQYGEYSDDILEIARKNLQEQFAVVGLTERFNETLILLKRAFGWKTPYYTRANVSQNRPHRRDVPPETLQLIKQYNKLDMELYLFAGELFEDQVRQQNASFLRELELFNWLNKYHGRLSRSYDTLRRPIKYIRRRRAGR